MKMYIDGKWLETKDMIEVLNPFDGTVVDTVEAAGNPAAEALLKSMFTGAADALNTDFSAKAQAVIDAGATTVNIPDTVGYAMPEQFGNLIEGVFKNVPNIGRAVVSVHCHNDLGLAVANSLEALKRGARHWRGLLMVLVRGRVMPRLRKS